LGVLSVYDFTETPFAVDNFAEVISPSQTAVLTVGKMKKKVTVSEEGKPMVRTVADVTLSCDQRVIDEDTAAHYLDILRKFVSHPQILLSE